MPKDPIQDVARLVTEVVRAHGAEELLVRLPEDVQKEIGFHCMVLGTIPETE